MAARAGHDLVLEVQRWEATLEVGPEPALRLEADGASLHAREGRGGVKPLSDRDRGEIAKTNKAKVLRGASIAFRSTAVEAAGEGLRFTGDLTIGATTRPVTFDVAAAGEELTATATLRQSDWGITPYRGFMGALKVSDDVQVAFHGRLG